MPSAFYRFSRRNRDNHFEKIQVILLPAIFRGQAVPDNRTIIANAIFQEIGAGNGTASLSSAFLKLYDGLYLFSVQRIRLQI